MKYFIIISFLFIGIHPISAKKVKFSVNMTGQTISSFGVHISGDFQTIAGYSGGDWNSETTEMKREDSTSIYSVTVDIPAFRKYEYVFVNGNQFYESEFIPEASRVGYGVSDNRFIYIDSLNEDTFKIGAILFGGNAPQGLQMVRFKVDLNGKNIATDGVHLAGNFNQWNTQNIYMVNLDKKFCDVIYYLPKGNYSYKYYNGELISDSETVPTTCNTEGNRSIEVTSDTVLNTVCYSECSACANTGISSQEKSGILITPNPTFGISEVLLNRQINTIQIYDMKGRTIISEMVKGLNTYTIHLSNPGLYIIKLNRDNQTEQLKLVVQ